jgi:hypothetical protein
VTVPPTSGSPTPTTPDPAPDRCPNCGAVVPDRFCGACGQETKSLRIPFHRIVGEAFAELFSLDSRIGRTLVQLFVRPGAATRTYLDGRRASQTSPVKLYLVTSFVFFLVSAIVPSSVGVVKLDGAQAEPDAKLELPDETIRGLRDLGQIGAHVAARLEALEREPLAVMEERITRGFAENAPKAMFFLVPVLAMLLRLAYARRRVFVAEHMVFSLHAHAVAFAFLLPGAALGSDGVRSAGLVASSVHFLLALRRVYGQGWPASIAKAAIVGCAYFVALGFTLLAVIALSIFA